MSNNDPAGIIPVLKKQNQSLNVNTVLNVLLILIIIIILVFTIMIWSETIPS